MFISNIHIKFFKQAFFTFISLFFFIPVTVWSQNSVAIAQKGEGIYRMLTRNGLSVSENLNEFIELNKDKLGKNNTLILGRKYILPGKAASKTAPAKAKHNVMHFDIFGDKYADVEVISNELKGAIYYIVSGHGGPDPGAVGSYNGHTICEDEYAYDVSIRLARKLIEKGAKVFMITADKNDGIRDDAYLKPDKDEVCYPNNSIPLNQTKRLKQRTNAVNKLYKSNRSAFQRMIAIHVDSRSKRENIDVFFYHDKRSKTGKKAANILQRTFLKKYEKHQPGRGYNGTVSTRGLYVVKNTYPVAVYIELGNVNHRRDIQRIIIPDNRQAVANWIAEGLVTDFKTNK